MARTPAGARVTRCSVFALAIESLDHVVPPLGVDAHQFDEHKSHRSAFSSRTRLEGTPQLWINSSQHVARHGKTLSVAAPLGCPQSPVEQHVVCSLTASRQPSEGHHAVSGLPRPIDITRARAGVSVSTTSSRTRRNRRRASTYTTLACASATWASSSCSCARANARIASINRSRSCMRGA